MHEASQCSINLQGIDVSETGLLFIDTDFVPFMNWTH